MEEMMRTAALIVAGLIFAVVAIAHLARYFMDIQIMMGNTIIPMNASLVGFVVATVLSLWMFFSAAKKK